ncbi:MAG: sodium/proton antiporter [Candidatus Accumulibacter sp.]|jgi:NhaB family Na+:H+ antiporter|nr:sodium/proton antiporter [Accumulibacter sp.]
MFTILADNFLGKTPPWYKLTILAFLAINPLAFHLISPFAAGWLLLMEFVFTLALALKCYPIPSGGLLALEAVIIGITTPDGVYREVSANLPTLLLLIFMVASVHYVKDVFFLVFNKLFIYVRRKYLLSFLFFLISASVSAFLDALTLMAVIIAVCSNFYSVYHRYQVSHKLFEGGDDKIRMTERELDEFCGFLRNIIMHGAIGTVIGGAMTIVGEPQNMMIGTILNWSFLGFFAHCSLISVPVMITGLIVCPLLEILRFPGFGYQLPENARRAIFENYMKTLHQIDRRKTYLYVVQSVAAILIFLALAFHIAEVGLIGIALIVLLAAFTGATREHDFVDAFHNAMPFVTLLAIFFAILAVVHDQHLVAPLLTWVFTFQGKAQLLALYLANGTLSFVSDNVFIASVFINETHRAFLAGAFPAEWFEKLAVVVNMGTNVPAMATPNGHAALLFLLTSALAPMIRLSYMQMVKLALPYTVAMSLAGGLAVYFWL